MPSGRVSSVNFSFCMYKFAFPPYKGFAFTPPNVTEHHCSSVPSKYTFFNDELVENAKSPISVTVAGMVTVCKLVQ